MTAVLTFVFFWISAVITKFFLDYKTDQIVKKNPDSSARHYVDLPEQQKWSCVQCYQATLMAALTVVLCFMAACQCSPPEDMSRPDVVLGNTFFRNAYCREHMNYEQIRLFAAFIGYMIYDLSLLMSLMDNYLQLGSSEFEQFVHHLFCIYGSGVALICGRFLGVLMSASLLTEISTPNVNAWFLLSVHQMTSSKLYTYNAYSMFATFFFGRIVYQFYLIAWLLVPGVVAVDLTRDS